MNLSSLPKIKEKSKKRIGRGHGSGRGGHTATRGTKGQNSRTRVSLFFQGTKVKKSLIKRLPFIRGKDKFRAKSGKPIIINLKYLNLFAKDEEVNLSSLKAKGFLPADLSEDTKIKILGEGEIKVPLIIALPISKGAREKIEKAGGRILIKKEEIKNKKENPKEKSTKAKTKKVKGK
ncbi:50S ribosomal protein L15 [Candidatus Shapirobacteria bacterium CG03_land_8_20_14_0_80_39_12]|uniref:Large ribosomal subunit protein uL15 n=1 Tax=Candidatus Shapirobacteria bacterium CG03_land_8_20_14_0_80_39_12 TaxID=1974879 RepID=A0A2M7BEN8_9BACT|nr:MAG: 50S ribosomal protein L15 [Candidatus Shapirobacteria bacterium CG03_land_8_20_14_0_80_39_12]